jgi:hypothetical protein
MVMKASHAFNLLDARHAISVTERQRFILRVRTLSRGVAQAYFEARKKLGFRYKMDLTPLDATLVKGSHGVVTGEPHNTPIFASSEPRLLDSNSLQATDVQASILDHLFRD